MKTKSENEKGGENNKIKTTLFISPHAVKIVMLARSKIKIAYPRYYPSLYFPSTNSSKYLKYLLEKFGDDFQNPIKGLRLISDIIHQIHFLPKHSLQTQHVYRTNIQELQNLNAHKFDSIHTFQNLPIFYMNKLTMLSIGVLI